MLAVQNVSADCGGKVPIQKLIIAQSAKNFGIFGVTRKVKVTIFHESILPASLLANESLLMLIPDFIKFHLNNTFPGTICLSGELSPWISPIKFLFLLTLSCAAFIFYTYFSFFLLSCINPLNPELNPICYLLALLGAHHFLHVSRIRVKLLTFSLLMSYIYGAPILDVSRSHTTTQHSR